MLIPLFKKISILESKYLQLPLLYALSFSIPFFVQGPQLLVGSLINFLLILSISEYKFKEIIPVLILPSLSVYLHGLLFTGATNFLLYLIPFIAISNALYVLVFKYIKTDYLNIYCATFFKTVFLFTCTYVLFRTIGLPQAFLSAMGIMQFVTGITGGIIAVVLTKRISSAQNTSYK